MSSHLVNFCFWFLLFLLFLFLVLLVLSGDIETNPGPIKHNFKMFYCNVRGLKANLDDLSVASANFDMICCTETLVSSFRHKSELIIPNFNCPILFRRNEITRSWGLCVYARIGFTACRISQYECNCHEVLIIRVCPRSKNYLFFGLWQTFRMMIEKLHFCS